MANNQEKPLEASDDFEAAYKNHADSIYTFLLWRTNDPEVAKDLTSDVFLKAWRARANFTTGSVRAWLYRIARNRLIDHWRKRKDVPTDDAEKLTEPQENFSDSLNDQLDTRLQMERLAHYVQSLPKDMRQVVNLRFVQGLSCKQVSAEVGLSESNVRVLQYRGLRKLREYMK